MTRLQRFGVRVVVDTHVLISGIFWRGKAGRILEALAAGLFTLCVSVPILDDYLEVIDRIAAKTGHPELAERWHFHLLEQAVSSTAEPMRLTICFL